MMSNRCRMGRLKYHCWVSKSHLRIESYFFLCCVSLRYEMSEKLHLICMKTKAKIRCNLKTFQNSVNAEK